MEKIIAKILEKIIANMSGTFRQAIIDKVKELEIAAEESQNAWDDIAVLVLKVALGIE